jgi:PIN domain nuclease of toxin-antitoxin system
MAIKHVVDTHALVWFLEGNARLGSDARTVLSFPESDLVLPIIALAEACWIVQHGRTSIPTVADLLDAVDADPRVTVAPLDRAVLDKSLMLGTIDEMHDRQIVATALVLNDRGADVTLLSRDENIRRSGLVKITW